MRKFMAVSFIWLAMGVMSGAEEIVYPEVAEVITRIQQAMNQGQEEMVTFYTAALELVKKATVSVRAEAITRKLRQQHKLSRAQFAKLREQFPFVDLVIGHAVSRQTGEKLSRVMEWRKEKDWPVILKEKGISAQATCYLLELTPAQPSSSDTAHQSVPQ